MPGEKNSRLNQLYRKRWVDYLRSLETITALQQALKQAAEESARQIEEIRELLEADWKGAMVETNQTLFGQLEKGTKESRPSKPAQRPAPGQRLEFPRSPL